MVTPNKSPDLHAKPEVTREPHKKGFLSTEFPLANSSLGNRVDGSVREKVLQA